MGSRLSRIHRSNTSQQPTSPAPARVVAADGSLKEFSGPSPVSVSDVLGSGGDNATYFMCNSDALYFNEDVPALAAGELLRPGQIYFILLAPMLGKPLSSADMAALAVKASAALAAKKQQRWGGGGKKVRVMPVHEESYGDMVNEKLNEKTLGEFSVLSSPVRKAEKTAPPPPLKRALSTIQEDAE